MGGGAFSYGVKSLGLPHALFCPMHSSSLAHSSAEAASRYTQATGVLGGFQPQETATLSQFPVVSAAISKPMRQGSEVREALSDLVSGPRPLNITCATQLGDIPINLKAGELKPRVEKAVFRPIFLHFQLLEVWKSLCVQPICIWAAHEAT